MKGREKEDFKTMTADQLNVKLREAEDEHFRMQFRHASNPLKNPMQIRFKRRDIARLKTWLHLKEGKTS